jgi:hypothetical protein
LIGTGSSGKPNKKKKKWLNAVTFIAVGDPRIAVKESKADGEF